MREKAVILGCYLSTEATQEKLQQESVKDLRTQPTGLSVVVLYKMAFYC